MLGHFYFPHALADGKCRLGEDASYPQWYYPHCFRTTQFINNKLAKYGTDGRLLLTANFKVT